MNASSANGPIKVMVVDDSAVVRGLMTRALEQDPLIRVVASAHHGAMALGLLKQYPVDVIILDIEMPEMDGMTALPKLLAMDPNVKIIMASTLTHRNASISLEALKKGASDYLPKPSASNQEAVKHFYRELIEKVKALGGKTYDISPVPVSAAPAPVAKRDIQPRAIGIGASTGGPQALLAFFEKFKGKPSKLPIFITQHMPATFTAIMAENIAGVSGRPCAEAQDGEVVQPGHIYVAPGDFHMEVIAGKPGPIIRLNQNPPENFCRPAVDPMMRSLASVYGNGLLAIIFTGMGHDGLKGCQEVVKAGGVVTAQDEASSIVWGMPRAVSEAGICTRILPPQGLADYVLSLGEG